jgi:hypothetical protein
MVIGFILFINDFIVFFVLNSANKDQPPDLVRNFEKFNHEPITSVPGMDDAEFRQRGKEMIDYIADYLKHIK